MPMTVRDIVMDADLFRRAYPCWPSPAPEEAPMTITELREALIAEGMTADSPAALDGEAEQLARQERQS